MNSSQKDDPSHDNLFAIFIFPTEPETIAGT